MRIKCSIPGLLPAMLLLHFSVHCYGENSVSTESNQNNGKITQLPELIIQGQSGSVINEHEASNYTIIGSKQISKSGARSLADLLVKAGGIRISSVSGNPSRGAVHMRGFGENSSSRVRIMIDGRSINRVDMGSVSLLEAPLSRIEKIEILRGSQSARFGDNAIGGVINIVTKQGNHNSTSLELAAGSEESYIARLSHTQSYKQHQFSFDYEHNSSDGWRENAFNRLNSSSLRYKNSEAFGGELDLGLSWSKESGGFPGPLSNNLYQANPQQSIYTKYGMDDQYFNETQNINADATLRWQWNDSDIDIPLSFYQRDMKWNLGPGFHTDNLMRTYTLSPQWKSKLGKYSLTTGAELRHDSLDVAQFAQIQRITQTGKAALKRYTLGLFADAAYEVLPRWKLTSNARWQYSRVNARANSYRFSSDPTLNFKSNNSASDYAWQLGILWQTNESTRTWLRYDKLYRLPSTDEIASYQGFPLTRPFNEELKAETGHNLELGTKWSNSNWELSINGFAQWLNGEIAYDYKQNLNVNLADTQRIGAEATVNYRSANWSAALHYNYIHAEYQSGSYSDHEVYLVPNHSLDASLTCKLIDHLESELQYQFTGTSYEGNDFLNNQKKLPAYHVTNLILRYSFKEDHMIYLRVNNLLDEQYATLKYNGVWYPANGRQWLAGIRFEF